MAENAKTEGPPNMAALVGGIITDAQKLIRHQSTPAPTEGPTEWTKMKTAALAMAAGGVIALVGALLLAFMLVHLLQWATPREGYLEPSTLPLWVCYLIVGGVFALIGGGLLFRGISRANE